MDAFFPFMSYCTEWRSQRRMFHQYYGPACVSQHRGVQEQYAQKWLLWVSASPKDVRSTVSLSRELEPSRYRHLHLASRIHRHSKTPVIRLAVPLINKVVSDQGTPYTVIEISHLLTGMSWRSQLQDGRLRRTPAGTAGQDHRRVVGRQAGPPDMLPDFAPLGPPLQAASP